MGFQKRIQLATEFEAQVESYLRGRKYIKDVARNGTEHTHPQFVSQLRNNNDEGSKFVRFAPDGICLQASGHVIHWEAKAGKCIEKDAYETYMKYKDMGCNVVVFVQRTMIEPVSVFWQHIERVGFVPSINIVGMFPVNRRHPIDPDDWICPRMGHGYSGNGSGTPYKEIDFETMRIVTDFYV